MVDATLRCAPPTFVGIILDYRCTCACRHCLYACSPRRREPMGRDTLAEVVDALAALTPRPSVHLAGGEAFLDPGLLLDGVRAVSGAGLEMDFIETNAAWFGDPARAQGLLEGLARAGAPRLLISCTPFHAETIPLRKVAGLYALAEEVFGPGGAILWTPELYAQLASIDDERTIPFERYVEALGATSAAFSVLHRFPMTLAGRAATGLGDLVGRAPAHRIPSRPCRAALLGSGHAHFGPTGHHLPGYCAGIHLGDHRDLSRLVSQGMAAEELPVAARLAEGGVAGLLRWAEQEAAFVRNPAGYTGTCDLCQAIRGHLLGKGEPSADLGPRGFYEELGLV